MPQLAEYFLERATARNVLPAKILSESAMRNLINRNFTGNVRELENIIERAVVSSGMSPVILPEHLSDGAAGVAVNMPNRYFLSLPFKAPVARLERALIRQALLQATGNRSEAARLLGINRRLLYDKIQEHQIDTN